MQDVTKKISSENKKKSSCHTSNQIAATLYITVDRSKYDTLQVKLTQKLLTYTRYNIVFIWLVKSNTNQKYQF